ncbi:MAG: hypothetical protein KAI47_09460, partial [Deltaproteobacteria bacterium]|nr:hypothetical protein [Deltaproteobacteria bacterium]
RARRTSRQRPLGLHEDLPGNLQTGRGICVPPPATNLAQPGAQVTELEATRWRRDDPQKTKKETQHVPRSYTEGASMRKEND